MGGVIDKPLPAPQSSQRSTFRVARVQRQLQALVDPRVILTPKPQLRRVMADPVVKRVVVKAQAKKPQPKREKGIAAEQPRMESAQGKTDLKCRPKMTSSSGNGAGRSFVPWGKC